MGVFRVKKNSNYVVMDKTSLRDERLSWKAKGLHAYMLSMPDDWRFYREELSTHAKDGVDSVKTALKELTTHGYLKRERRNDDQGRLTWETVVYEVPQIDREPLVDNPPMGKPSVGKPPMEKPPVDNPPLLNNELLNNELLNNDSLSTTTKDPVDLIAEKYSDLRTIREGRTAYPKQQDYQSISLLVNQGYPVDQIIGFLEQCFTDYEQRNPNGKISSFKYCEKYIVDHLEALKAKEVAKNEAKGGSRFGSQKPRPNLQSIEGTKPRAQIGRIRRAK